MAIKFYLQPNPVTADPYDQAARVAPNAVLDLDDIVKMMLRRGTLVTETDIRAVLQVFFDTVTDSVADGNTVNLPLAKIRPGIGGVFRSATDIFDNSRHVKKASLSAGSLLNQKIVVAKVEKIMATLRAPVLLEYADINSQTTNSKLTPGGLGLIMGEELKFNPLNPAEGIFLVDAAGTSIPVTILASRTDTRLVFNIPPHLKTGDYTLEVRRGYGNQATLRTGSLNDPLLVS